MLGHTYTVSTWRLTSVRLAQVSASGTASPTEWQRGHVSVASRGVGLKSSENMASEYRRWWHATGVYCREASDRPLKLTLLTGDDHHVAEHQGQQVPVA